MKKTALLLPFLLATCHFSPAPAIEVERKGDGTVVMVLSKEEAAACLREGGCQTVTMEALKSIVKEASKRMCGKEI
jgi:hypothetical protein